MNSRIEFLILNRTFANETGQINRYSDEFIAGQNPTINI